MGAPPEMPRWQRLLLPGGMQDRGGRRSARDWVVDGLMFAIAVGIGAAILVDTADDHTTLTLVLDAALGGLACLGVWVRRPHAAAFGFTTSIMATVVAGAAGAGLIALFNAAIRLPARTLGALGGVTVVSAAIYPLIYPDRDAGYWTDLVIGELIIGLTLMWGLYVRAQRDRFDTLRERAEQAEAQARDAERRRIAREMHDVLAHRMSLLSLHAGALEFRPDAPPEEIAEAAAVIRSSAHAALQELREVIGVLREDEPDLTEPPQPTLAEIPALVEESRAAGMRVDLECEAGLDVAASLGRTAYRVVQEGLTNARKHAPDAAVRVLVRRRDGRLEVEVVSRPAVGVAVVPGAGTGLIGLAERVELAGGSLSHGPNVGGDFVLRAQLPWTP